MSRTHLEFKEEGIVIFNVGSGTFELQQDVDFSKFPYVNFKNVSILFNVINTRDVVKRFVLENGISKLSNRIEDKLNKEYTIYSLNDSKKENMLFSIKKRWLELSGAMWGAKDITESKYKIVKIFSSIEEFKADLNDSDCLYAEIPIVSNELEHIFSRPISVLICHDDFGKDSFSKGSEFVKLEKLSV